MATKIRPKPSGYRGKELLDLCREKLVIAARDLARFTQCGLDAQFIVTLAQKCEEFENLLDAPPSRATDFSDLEESIRKDLIKICETGQKMFRHQPNRFSDYQLIRAKTSRQSAANPTTTHAA